jgi:hypothetical protein
MKPADELQHELKRLTLELPLGTTWGEPILFADTAVIAGFSLNMCGLVARDGASNEVSGSAAEHTNVPLSRAYFELIERVSVIEAMSDSNHDFAVLDAEHRPLRSAERSTVFPKSADESERRYARSNGVAVARTWPAACKAAALELIERDRILRSWYGVSVPRPIAVENRGENFGKAYAVETYSFDDPVGVGDAIVCGVFAFPKNRTDPLAFGYGAACESAAAVGKARQECLQRLAFLWGESLPTQPPPFAPTALYHQEYFLQPAMTDTIRDWLRGAHLGSVLTGGSRMEFPNAFVDLTPSRLAGALFVARALPTSELDLVFGRGHPAIRGTLPTSLEVHPIA